MGAKNSTSNQLNETINKTATESISKIATESSGNSYQKMKLDLVAQGKDSVIDGVTLLQKSEVSISSLTKSAQSGNLQSTMLNDIMNSISEETSTFPALGSAQSKSKVKNIIKNEINNKFSVESISKMNLSINQQMDASIVAIGGAAVKNILMSQTAKAIAKQVNELSSSIVSKLESENLLKNEISKKETGLFDFGSIWLIIIIIAIIAAAGLAAKHFGYLKI